MKRGSRKKFFSLILVPDQEQDPKSISMSYTTGRVLIVLMIFLSLHIIVGGIGYYRVIKLVKISSRLEEENQDLTARNRKIEKLVKVVEDMARTSDKINKAFGVELGLNGNATQNIGSLRYNSTERISPSAASQLSASSLPRPAAEIQNNQYLLTETSGDYFNPKFLPTHLPVQGYLTTRFQRGGRFPARSHNGIDIAAKQGTVIRSAGAGIVVLADWTPDFGNVIIISHGNGYVTYYAHAMRLLVDQGTRVDKAAQIALLGSSGRSSAPHLHFEIWKEGEPLDPERFIYALQQNGGN